jgi:diadenosine tetraphosphatase ApaH/serine/threonine PP2A family protein phosphatase
MTLAAVGLYKYDQSVYDMLMDSFDMIPTVCVVNGKFLAVHGGLSPEFKTVSTAFCLYLTEKIARRYYKT